MRRESAVLREHLEWMKEQEKWMEENKPLEVAEDGKADYDSRANGRQGRMA